MDRGKFISILNKSQQNTSCHQRNIQLLSQLYEKSSLEDFFPQLLNFLDILFHTSISHHNQYVERSIDFLAKFCAEIYKKNIDEEHEFLCQVITEVLEYNNLNYVEARYHSCHFITLLLKYIGNEVTLDNNLCDFVQEAMLERITDPKMNIRLQAIMTLIRLQDPQNYECPVINAYISALKDSKVAIRHEVVKNIAPNMLTLPKILERTRDVDYSVRLMAFNRCADIGPKSFNIEDRQALLNSGFNDDNEQVRNVLIKQLLPKWLTIYKGEFLDFLKGLKLDADDEDIKNTMEISRKVMNVFFKKYPIEDFLAILELNQSKLIPVEDLTTDSSLYLNILVDFLRKDENYFEFLQRILPELTAFCHYIEEIINYKMQDNLDQWKYLDLQTILHNLFDIIDGYDLSDEVGRRTLQNLLLDYLQKYKFDRKLTNKLMKIFGKCSTNVDIFTNSVCEIISNIREPLTEMPISQEMTRERDFAIAELRVKLNVLNGEKEDGIEAEDYEKVSIIQNEIIKLNKQLENIDEKFINERVRTKKDDFETICRCLDILISLLELDLIQKITPALSTCKDDFILPLISSENGEVHWRILNCLVLFAIIDKNTAKEYANVICIPIATYRIIPNYNKMALIKSIQGMCDLLRIYSADFFWNESTDNSCSANNLNMTKKRKLYQHNEEASPPQSLLNCEFFIDILLDILDDECDEIKNCALDALTNLIMDGLFISSSLISRIVLKWYNPVIENKQKDKFQIKLGLLLEKCSSFKSSREIFENALIPTLNSIINAPKTSPLYEISIENVIQFFSAVLNLHNKQGIINNNNEIAINLCLKITEVKNDRLIVFLAKTLCYLDCQLDNSSITTELLRLTELLLNDLKDKTALRYINKFVKKIKQLSVNSANLTENTNVESSTINNEQLEENTNVQIKRKKQRGRSRRKSTQTEGNSSNSSNSTELNTIIEDSMENLSIDTNDSERNQKTILTETSSDTESGTSGGVRRSRRCKSKKS